MPEGPELHMAARFINQVASRHSFGGKIVKSEVSTKNPDVDFQAENYNIHAETRGKELKVFLEDKKKKGGKTHLLFRFGMSGCFKLTPASELPKHAHLQFWSLDKEKLVLSFVDYRRFGRWEIEGNWGKDRGPDPMFDYVNFRKNVLDNLKTAAFNRPICETLLNQKYFNGIGNYLRAEILFRAGIAPFTEARGLLEPLKEQDVKQEIKQEVKVKQETPDILELCSIVATEVLSLDKGKNYDPDDENSENSFSNWLRCYYVEGMTSLKDGNGRTIWFQGDAGPMCPKNAKVVGRKGGTGSKVPKSGGNIKEEAGEEKKKAITKVKNESKVKTEKKLVKKEKKPVKKVEKHVVKEEAVDESEEAVILEPPMKKENKTTMSASENEVIPVKRSRRSGSQKSDNYYTES